MQGAHPSRAQSPLPSFGSAYSDRASTAEPCGQTSRALCLLPLSLTIMLVALLLSGRSLPSLPASSHLWAAHSSTMFIDCLPASHHRMCGRITLTRPNLESIASELNVSPEGCRGYPLLEPHYNIAPTSVHPILTLDDSRQRRISPMTWGSIPRTEKA